MTATAELYLEWEGVGADVSRATGCDDPPVDAIELADCCELEVEPWTKPGAQLDEAARVIKANLALPARKLHMLVAHEIGHFAQRRAGLPDLEEGARFIGGTFMMPRDVMLADIRRTGWDVIALHERHVNVSPLALAVRITQLRDAVISIIDPRGRKRPWRRASPWITDPRATSRTPSRWERQLASAAWEAGGRVHGDDLCYAVPVIDYDGESEDRVLVVCELEQLSLRL